MCQGTYSPKIREDLIPYLYKIAQATQTPMTKIVDLILRPVIENLEGRESKKTCDSVSKDWTAISLNPIPQHVAYVDEIRAMVDVVLGGNLRRIAEI